MDAEMPQGERGWIKVHVAVDAESKELLSIEVTDEKKNPLLKTAVKVVRPFTVLLLVFRFSSSGVKDSVLGQEAVI